jgi:Tfp pilus assembly protein PilX
MHKRVNDDHCVAAGSRRRRSGRPKAVPPDRGVALILVLLAMLVLSVLAASIVFTARSEAFASYNYKLDTQADYLAKAGIQRAINWFRSNHYQAVKPQDASTYYHVAPESTLFPYLFITNYSPVECKSGCPSTTGSPPATSAVIQLVGYGNGLGGSSSSNYPTAINNSSGTAGYGGCLKLRLF